MLMDYHSTSAQNTNTTQNDLPDSSLYTLNGLLSKSFIKILTTLYHTPHMSQKVLAATLQTSPTSLSNIISRMNEITPKLLARERIGRIVYYSLTEAAEHYVEQELLSKRSEQASSFVVHLSDATISHDDPSTARAKLLLSQFQNRAGDDWAIIMDNYLLNELNENIGEKKNFDQDLYNIYMNFMNYMIQLRIHEKHSSIDMIYSILKNNILTQRIKAFFNYRLEIYYNLCPLFDLEKKETEKAYMLLNYVFAQIKPSVFVQDSNETISPAALPVSRKEYVLIEDSIRYMAEEFSKYDGNIQQAVNHWQEQLFTTNTCLYFIASKCETMYLMGIHT